MFFALAINEVILREAFDNPLFISATALLALLADEASRLIASACLLCCPIIELVEPDTLLDIPANTPEIADTCVLYALLILITAIIILIESELILEAVWVDLPARVAYASPVELIVIFAVINATASACLAETNADVRD